MTNALDSALAELITKSVGAAETVIDKSVAVGGKVIEFASGELPHVVREILVYNGVYSFAKFAFFGFVLPSLFWKCICKSQINYCKRNDLDLDGYIEEVSAVPLILTGFSGLFVALISVIGLS